MNNEDDEDFEEFEKQLTTGLSDRLLSRLYEETGTSDNNMANKGFILSFISQDGEPLVVHREGSIVAFLAMRKALELAEENLFM